MRLKDKLNLYRRYPHWSRRQCIFIHVPKAAGTSINRALYGRTLGHYRASDIKRWFPKLYQQCFVFAVVRNPWDRVHSAYQFAVQGSTASMGIRNAGQYRVPEFDSFERFLFDWLAEKQLDTIDYVFQPQHDFVEDAEGGIIVDFIGRFESIPEDIAEIESRLEMSLDLRHYNRTSATGIYRDAYTSKDMVRLVGEIYSEDIAQFGYEF